MKFCSIWINGKQIIKIIPPDRGVLILVKTFFLWSEVPFLSIKKLIFKKKLFITKCKREKNRNLIIQIKIIKNYFLDIFKYKFLFK